MDESTSGATTFLGLTLSDDLIKGALIGVLIGMIIKS